MIYSYNAHRASKADRMCSRFGVVMIGPPRGIALCIGSLTYTFPISIPAIFAYLSLFKYELISPKQTER